MFDVGEKVRVALVGFGNSGAGIHAPLIDGDERFELSVIIARDPESRERALARYPDATVTDDLRAARGCALAVVALPPAYRRDDVEVLVELGIRVVLEKPMASDAIAASRLFALAGASLAVFHNRRWDADYLTLLRLRNEGAWTGEARLESRMHWWMPTVKQSWRNEMPGGGILTEVGTHLIDQALDLFGAVDQVYAHLDARRNGAVADDDVFVALHHRSGDVSHLWAGPLGDPVPRFTLASADTLITLPSGDPQQKQMAEGMSVGDDSWGLPDSTGWSIRSGDDESRSIAPERGRWSGFYDGVFHWVVDGGPPPVSGEEGIATMQVIEAARQSSESSQIVRLTER